MHEKPRSYHVTLKLRSHVTNLSYVTFELYVAFQRDTNLESFLEVLGNWAVFRPAGFSVPSSIIGNVGELMTSVVVDD